MRTRIILTALLVLCSWAFYSPPTHAAEPTTDKVLHNAVTAGTANGVELDVSGMSAVGLQITISDTATLVLEVTSDGTNYFPKLCTLTTDALTASSVTASGLYQCNVAGMAKLRARISANTGEVTVFGKATSAVFSAGGSAGATSGTLSIDQTTPGTSNGVALTTLIAGEDQLNDQLYVALRTLISGEDQLNNLLMQSGGAVRQHAITSGVTTNTTSVANIAPTGNKTFYGQVVCSSGACVQTQAIYGDVDSDAANGVLLCTITLSATTRDQAACSVSTAPWSFYYVVTTATSGTAATGAVYAMY